jgi:error-prone DNA polymerase
MDFVHLHVHSHYSKGWGVATIEELCGKAQSYGMRGLALTDTNGLYGMIDFIHTAKKYGIQPIAGSEIVTKDNRAILLVKDGFGYANICRIISDRNCDQGFNLIESLKKRVKGLIIISDDINLLKSLKEDKHQDLFVELSPCFMMHRAYAFSRASGIPPIATNRVYLASPDQFYLHRILRAISLKKRLSRLQRHDTCFAENSLKPPEDMACQFPHAPQAIRNSVEILKRCKTNWNFSKTIFPVFREDLSNKDAFFNLKEKSTSGCLQRYGKITPEIQSRLDYELNIIQDMGFAHYFLIVADIASQSTLSCGRGSGAASIISYALGITHVDPIKHNLSFERFLNPARTDPPDIDLDFPWDERDTILDYVFSKYGNSSVAMVSNHNSFGLRLAIHETARVCGLSEDEINRNIKKIRRERFINKHLSRKGLENPWGEILTTADRLEGKFYCLSTHCGGVVLVPGRIRDYCPVEISPKGIQVLQWEKDSAGEAGLVKIDLLGNRSLSVIRDCLERIYKNYGITIAYASLDPLADRETINIFYTGDTIGVFYFESPATRQVLSQAASCLSFDEYENNDHFNINVIITSIIRPASRGVIQTWISRLHGQPWEHIHPLLKSILEETLGVLVFQEQISQVAIAMAGFSVEESDALRKIVSKKSKDETLKDFYLKFVKGARIKGMDNKVINDIWMMITSFEGYSFCKSHSASYTLVAYKSAFLRAHYPAEFMASVISNQGGYYTTLAYISEARRMGLTILPPDINLSDIKYTGKDKWVRVGFMQLKNISKHTLDNILHNRMEHGPYMNITDFLKRSDIQLHETLTLIKAGCFDSISGGLNRPSLVWEAYRFFSNNNHGVNLDSASTSRASCPTLHPYKEDIAYKHEADIFGFVISTHPLNLFKKSLMSLRHVHARDLFRYTGRYVTVVGWPVIEKVISTEKNGSMEFISFEDTTGMYEAIFFPGVYRRFLSVLGQDRAYILKGKIEMNFGTVSLIANWVGVLTQTMQQPPTAQSGFINLNL